MKAIIVDERPNTTEPGCSDVETMAERELAAFFRAVKELFGLEVAKHSADDWLREVNTAERLPASIREWRSLTRRVAARLAGRVAAVLPADLKPMHLQNMKWEGVEIR